MKQIRDEFARMIANKDIVKALIIPILVALVFCYLFSNNQILEAQVFVIDLDNSNYSRQFIDKLDASPYIKVAVAVNTPVDAGRVFTGDHYQALVSLPKGMEQNIYRNVQTNIGFLMDNTVTAAISNLRQAFTEIVTTENMTLGIGKLKVQGMTTAQATGLLSNLAPQQRLLFNPTGDFVNSNVFGFFNLIFMLLLLLATAKIVPQLKREDLFKGALLDPLGLICRTLPYAFLHMISFVLCLGLLKQFMDLRFAGSFFAFLLPLFIYTFSTGLLGMLIGCAPGGMQAKMGPLVFCSFYLSNILFPLAIMPYPLQVLAQCLPLNWFAKFYRAIALRGTPLSYLNDYLGGFLILTAVILCLTVFMIMRAAKKALRQAKIEEIAAEAELTVL